MTALPLPSRRHRPLRPAGDRRRRYRRHRLSRRSVLTRAGLIGAGFSGAALLGGCGGRDSDAAPADPAGEDPRPGGHLAVAFQTAGTSETLDPHAAALFVDGARGKALYDKLVDLAADMSPVPRLAESLEPNDDATRWRITLREASFHDRRPVTADDVLYSYRRILDPDAGRRARSLLAPIDLAASRAVDARTVELVLDRPVAELPQALGGFGTWIVPEGSDDFTEPVGSGPFRFVSFTPGGSLVVERFEDYWDGAPYLDTLEFVPVNEETARVNALVGGQVGYAHDLTVTSARTYADEPQVQILAAPGALMHAFAMKLDRPPFDRPEARQAFRLLADRQELVDTVLSGMGDIGNDLFGKGLRFYADELPQRQRDVARAQELLDRAGAGDLGVTLHTAEAGGGLVDAASLFAEQAEAAGITVEVRVRDADTFWADTFEDGAISSYRSGTMPIETHITNRLLSGAPQNITRWESEEFEAQYAAMQSTVDEGDRAGIYHDMQAQLHDRCGLLVWGFADWLVGAAGNLRGVTAAPPNTLDWARFDRAWLA